MKDEELSLSQIALACLKYFKNKIGTNKSVISYYLPLNTELKGTTKKTEGKIKILAQNLSVKEGNET